MNSLPEALGLSFAMGAVILFCRAFPFLFFSGGEVRDRGIPEAGKSGGERPRENGVSPLSAGKKRGSSRRAAFLDFVQKTVPPAAMTVLAFNAIGGAFLTNPRDGFLTLAASAVTALLHVWKRNSLVSIFGGTALYMILIRVIG